MIKTFEGMISVKFIHRGDKIFQHFTPDNVKTRKYLTDTRFIVYDKFQKKIKELSLSNDENFIFIERRDESEKIVLEFKIKDMIDFQKPKNYFFVIPGFLPLSPGCDQCLYKKNINETFIYCNFKDKTLTSKLKNCRFYKQPHDLFKT